MAAVPSLVEDPAAEAVRALYERWGRQIFSFCLQRLGNREEAEDATQSTFLNALRGLQRGVSPEHESAWLYKIAHNVCLTRHRSAGRRRRIESPGDLEAMQDVLPAPASDPDELIRLPDALAAMPEQQRRALLLREWQGFSYREIATELGITQSAVETLLFRARRSLARGLESLPKARKRLSAGGNWGSFAAGLKALLVGGGAKVAATVATVAVTSVAASTPTVRDGVERLVRMPAPPVAVAIANPTKQVVRARVVAAAPPPVVHAAPQPAVLVVHRVQQSSDSGDTQDEHVAAAPEHRSDGASHEDHAQKQQPDATPFTGVAEGGDGQGSNDGEHAQRTLAGSSSGDGHDGGQDSHDD